MQQRRVVLLVLTCAVLWRLGFAQTGDTGAEPEVAQPPRIDVAQPRGEPDGFVGWHLDLTGGFFMEAWDLNLYKEQLLGGAISVSRRVTPKWTVGVETGLLHVNQEPIGDVFLPTLSVLLRWTAFRVGETSVFVEASGGASYASDEVPNRGTRFNLVSQTGVGIARPLSSRIAVVGGLRWLHLSNNSLDGRDHNPDIQALGLYVGWRVD